MKNHIKSTTAIILVLIMLVNIFPISAYSSGSDAMSLTASSVSGKPGDTVTLDITVADNPGLSSLKFNVAYADELILQDVELGSGFGPYLTVPPNYSNPLTVTLISPYEDCSAEGVIAKLTFLIADTAAAGEYDVDITYIQKETYNSNFEDVAVSVTNGSVTVEKEPLPDGMSLTAESVIASRGETVDVDITIAGNSGLSSLKFDIEYDSDLTLTDVKLNNAFGPYVTCPPASDMITLISPYNECTVNGVIATLTFSIAEDADAGKHEIKINLYPDETYDDNFETVDLNIINGSIIIDGPEIEKEVLLLEASSVVGKPGDTVKIDVSISDNPGLASLQFDIAHASELRLIGVELSEEFGSYVTAPPFRGLVTLLSPFDDCTTEGVIATYTFKIADDAAEGEYTVYIVPSQSETYNSNFENVEVSVTDGCVTVENEPVSKSDMTITVENAEGAPGETIKVDVIVANNPGISSLKFDVSYSEYLTLTDVDLSNAFGPYLTTPSVLSNPQKITFISPYADRDTNGSLATLTFKISDDAPEGNHDIRITYYQNETYNASFENVIVTAINGSVNVKEPELICGGNHVYTDGKCICGAIEPVNVIGSENFECEIDGSQVTVTSDAVCKLGYVSNGSYVEIEATVNSDGSYSFTAPEGVEELLLVTKGDLDMDGSMDSEDSDLLAKYLLPENSELHVELSLEQQFAADINGNGKLNSADKILIARSKLSEDHPLYKPLD